MEKIKKDKFNNFYDLFAETYWELSGYGVLSGNNPGILMSDSESNPTSALMFTPEGILIVGNHENDEFNRRLKDWFENNFIPKGIEEGKYEFEFYFNPKWEKTLKEIFKIRNLISYKRFHYLNNLEIDFQPNIPKGFEAKLITKKLINKLPESKHLKHIEKWIINNWEDYLSFEEKGFAYCILEDNDIVSYSISDCKYEDKCEIGIHTNTKYKKQGFAYQTVLLMLKYAKENKYSQVGWHCAQDNMGSFKTAEKTGFKLDREYNGYWGSFDETNHLVYMGIEKIKIDNDIENAENLFRKAERRKNMKDYLYYDIACALSNSKYCEKSIEYLKKAIKAGFKNKGHILDDPDLNNIREKNKWKEIEQLLNC